MDEKFRKIREAHSATPMETSVSKRKIREAHSATPMETSVSKRKIREAHSATPMETSVSKRKIREALSATPMETSVSKRVCSTSKSLAGHNSVIVSCGIDLKNCRVTKRRHIKSLDQCLNKNDKSFLEYCYIWGLFHIHS